MLQVQETVAGKVCQHRTCKGHQQRSLRTGEGQEGVTCDTSHVKVRVSGVDCRVQKLLYKVFNVIVRLYLIPLISFSETSAQKVL
jgi:hypothetical protein